MTSLMDFLYLAQCLNHLAGLLMTFNRMCFSTVVKTIVKEMLKADPPNMEHISNVCNNVFCAPYIIGIERSGVEFIF